MSKKPIYILGINSAYHESSAAIIKDGILIAAAEEERFNRIKHGKSAKVDNPHMLPIEAIEYCLREAEINFEDVDHIGFSFSPIKRLESNISVEEIVEPGSWGTNEGERLFYSLITEIPQKLQSLYKVDLKDRFYWIDHHVCHACSAFFVSPFNDAAVLSVDGIGEIDTVWFGEGHDKQLKSFGVSKYPDSLGFLWERISKHLGFGEYGVWKVMGMHSYGNEGAYYKCFREFVDYDDDGLLRINNHVTRFRSDHSLPIEELLGVPRRASEPLDQHHMDIAASLQKITNEVMLSYAAYLKSLTSYDNLCMAGGVALNCVANGILSMSGPFKNIYIQPSANDAGTALGAAYYIWNVLLGRDRRFVMEHAYWGPEYDRERVRRTLDFNGLKYRRLDNVAEKAAQLIADGNIIAWFQGRMEFGPRALGNRSILADPRKKELVNVINAKVKHREYFRPFAPSILKERFCEWFDGNEDAHGNVFMLNTFKVRADKRERVPAVTHIDGSSRPQIVSCQTNQKYYDLIRHFEEITGVPMVLNTSFNDNEPIICCPEDAVQTCVKTRLDYLIIDDFLVSL